MISRAPNPKPFSYAERKMLMIIDVLALVKTAHNGAVREAKKVTVTRAGGRMLSRTKRPGTAPGSVSRAVEVEVVLGDKLESRITRARPLGELF